ncbi:MAG TPA: hypothetical protein VGO55_11125 [Allosphingosinicella sp.]|jgi:hypothetical protein|nr:hypothetical protein [Allosphingosinicella sp.]
MKFMELKDAIAYYTGLEKDALHIHAALFIYILTALVFRRNRRSLLPWTVVFFFEIANELHDLWLNWGAPAHWLITEGAKDIWNTMLWPTAFLIFGRYSGWAQDRKARNAETGPPDGVAAVGDESGLPDR